MFKKAVLPMGITLIGTGLVALLVVAKPKPQSQDAPPPPSAIQVNVVPAKREVAKLAVSTQGTVYAKREIDLVAQVAGQITAVNDVYSEGGFFNPDEQLVKIDPRDYHVALLNAKARVAEAQRRLAEEQGQARQAKREWRDLGNKQANDLFMRKPQLAAAEANLDFALGDQAKAELDLSRTSITGPFSGRIKQVFADLGQYVSPGTVLARVYDSSVYEIRVPLTEAQAALIDLPLDTQTQGSAVTVSGQVAGQSRVWQGELVRADAYVDPQTRMYHAVVEIDTTRDDVQRPIPGLFVQVEIEGKEMAGVIKVPRSALYHGQKVVSIGEDKRAKVHQVKVLYKTEDHVWLRADVGDNAQIALEKQALLTDGAEVEPKLNAEQTMVSSNLHPNQEN